MKIYKLSLLLAFLTPFVAVPFSSLFSFQFKNEVVLAPEVNANWVPGKDWVDWRTGQAYSTAIIGGKVWMTKNFGTEELVTVQEAFLNAPMGWEVPSKKDWHQMFKVAGFFKRTNDLIPDKYYTMNFEYKGMFDPILGLVKEGDMGFFWANTEVNEYISISIPNRQLKYAENETVQGAKLAVRYVKK